MAAQSKFTVKSHLTAQVNQSRLSFGSSTVNTQKNIFSQNRHLSILDKYGRPIQIHSKISPHRPSQSKPPEFWFLHRQHPKKYFFSKSPLVYLRQIWPPNQNSK